MKHIARISKPLPQVADQRGLRQPIKECSPLKESFGKCEEGNLV